MGEYLACHLGEKTTLKNWKDSTADIFSNWLVPPPEQAFLKKRKKEE